jgi:hypothetical protein
MKKMPKIRIPTDPRNCKKRAIGYDIRAQIRRYNNGF